LLDSNPHPSTVKAREASVWIDFEGRKTKDRGVVFRAHTEGPALAECGRSAEAKHTTTDHDEADSGDACNTDEHYADNEKRTTSHPRTPVD